MLLKHIHLHLTTCVSNFVESVGVVRTGRAPQMRSWRDLSSKAHSLKLEGYIFDLGGGGG